MPSYTYLALHQQSGKQSQGVIEADTARQARSTLRDQGLLTLDIHETVEAARKSSTKTSRTRMSVANLALLTRQFSTLLEAGLPVEQVLTVLTDQAEVATERQMLSGIKSEILAGQSLGRALSNYPGVFNELYRTLVSAGEESGKLSEVMRRLADYVENRQALQNKTLIALLYPALILLVSIGMVTGLVGYVVPQIVKVFENSQQTLPFLTRALLWLSGAVRAWGLYAFVGLAASAWAGRQLLKNPEIRLRVDRWLLSAPIIGRLQRATHTARLSSTLSILSGAGVPLLIAMKAAGGVVGNMAMRGAVERASQQIREGVSLSRALAESKLFPPVLIHLIASGEATGRLEDMLDRAAKQQANELDTRLATFTALLEPLMILIMGAVVLVIVLAILLPIFNLNQLVK